jgi:hypothetical protein
MNADGYDDLYVARGNSEDSLSFIYFAGAIFDTLADVTISIDALVGAPAGDVNNDGYADIVTGFGLGSSSGDYVNVFFGGPIVDSIPDIRIFASDLPEYNLEFGRAVAGVGDVNGDGIDDFAAGAYNDFGIGRIYVFAGYQGTVGVPDIPRSLPTDFSLGQNYPNPFNSNTTIPFQLEHRSLVVIRVVNCQGQLVRALCNRQFSAGKHSIEWNGMDKNGNLVASGVYFCEMSTETQTASIKMVTLK